MFKATVRRQRATTMRAVPASDRTVVVRIDQIVQSPESLVDQVGQDITVVLPRRAALKAGQQLMIYANAGVFGDGVAVEAVDHRSPETVPAAMAVAAAAGGPVQTLAARKLAAGAAAGAAGAAGETTLAGRSPSTTRLGDYDHLMAVGRHCYGIFSANNTPDRANFPNGVVYQRNADFTSHRRLGIDNATPVRVSIDPFFFTVSG